MWNMFVLHTGHLVVCHWNRYTKETSLDPLVKEVCVVSALETQLQIHIALRAPNFVKAQQFPWSQASCTKLHTIHKTSLNVPDTFYQDPWIILWENWKCPKKTNKSCPVEASDTKNWWIGTKIWMFLPRPIMHYCNPLSSFCVLLLRNQSTNKTGVKSLPLHLCISRNNN